ncbi:UNVERIFIED_CONTAM: hypothetical protein Sindi_1312000 [Sesamum indicum]
MFGDKNREGFILVLSHQLAPFRPIKVQCFPRQIPRLPKPKQAPEVLSNFVPNHTQRLQLAAHANLRVSAPMDMPPMVVDESFGTTDNKEPTLIPLEIMAAPMLNELRPQTPPPEHAPSVIYRGNVPLRLTNSLNEIDDHCWF